MLLRLKKSYANWLNFIIYKPHSQQFTKYRNVADRKTVLDMCSYCFCAWP